MSKVGDTAFKIEFTLEDILNESYDSETNFEDSVRNLVLEAINQNIKKFILYEFNSFIKDSIDKYLEENLHKLLDEDLKHKASAIIDKEFDNHVRAMLKHFVVDDSYGAHYYFSNALQKELNKNMLEMAEAFIKKNCPKMKVVDWLEPIKKKD